MIYKITDHGNVLRLSRSSLKMHFGEVSETKGRERITATKLARTMGLDYPGDSAKEMTWWWYNSFVCLRNTFGIVNVIIKSKSSRTFADHSWRRSKLCRETTSGSWFHLSFEHFVAIYSYERRFQKPLGVTACRQYRRFMIETKWQTVA